MCGNVKMWLGEYLFSIGYPMVIVTTQDRINNEYPGEYFVWVQEIPSLKYTAVRRAISGIEPSDDQKADGITMTQEIVEGEALNFAKGYIQTLQFDKAKELDRFEPALVKECQLKEVDWKKTLLTLRRQDRLDENLCRSTAKETLSESLRSYLTLLMKTSPLTQSRPYPYGKK